MQLLFTRFPLESAYGGAEVQTIALMEELRRRGHTIGFLGSCSVLSKELRARDFPCVDLTIGEPPVTKWGAASFLWRAPRMRKKLLAALRGFPGVKAIFMLSMSEKILMTEWAHEQGIRVFWIEHDRVGSWLRQNPWLSRLRALSKIVTTIVVSDLSRDIYVELGWRPEDIRVIPNGIDLTRWKKRETSAETRGPELHIGTVARLSKEKGLDLLIEAVKDIPDALLDIVGSGKDETAIKTLAKRTNEQTTKRINVRPNVPDLCAFYQSLDIFVLPSREHDPFGLAAAEAMSLGIPTIVTDACGIAGSLTNGEDALIVPAGDTAALCAAIMQLRDPVLRATLGKAGAETARTRFSKEAMADQYEALLR